MVPTHVLFDTTNRVEVVSDFGNNRFLYRKLSEEGNRTAWLASRMTSLRAPHAIAFHPAAGRYFAVDTANNQVISFVNLDDSDDDITRYSEVAGVPIGKRPHDIAYNAVDGFLYVVDNSGVLRFRPDGQRIIEATFLGRQKIMDELNKSNVATKIGYMRSITIIDGVVYLINSALGNIIELGDFSNPSTWKAHINKDRSTEYADAGEFDKHGLILNDVDYYQGYWYATNYYPSTTHNYLGSKDNLKNKIIRWKTWEDFYNSNWQDLSHLSNPESIPYYFSKLDDRFFISMFHIGNAEGTGSGIYEIKTSLF